ncbi:MAG: family 16 glycosylhydrolase [Pseudomonadota bacterium]
MSLKVQQSGSSRRSRTWIARIQLVVASLAGLILSVGLCASSHSAPGAAEFSETVVWAKNIGGDALATLAGELFEADSCSDEARCHRAGNVRRTQDPDLHATYRSGDQCYSISLPNGSYDLVYYFVEPEGQPRAQRVMDISIEDRRVLSNLRVAEAAAGEPRNAAIRGFRDIRLGDGQLDTCVESRVGQAVLSGLLVRNSRFSDAGWNLVWEDDFSDVDAFVDNWTAEQWAPGRVNNEVQAYTTDQKNVRIEDGVLILEAHRTGRDAPAYSSGRVHSWGNRSLHYGRLDIRARVPEGRGVWPAIWLMPEDPYRYATSCSAELGAGEDDAPCDSWPNSGEIDLMEHIGHEPDLVHGTVHTRDFYAGLGTQVQSTIVVPDLGETFHTYSLVWREGALAMYVDGVRYFAYFDEGQGEGQWPFDHAFHIVMNLAVGGKWSDSHGPVEESAFPRRLEIDYVRIYEPEPAEQSTARAEQAATVPSGGRR